jgi:hypothetical protein
MWFNAYKPASRTYRPGSPCPNPLRARDLRARRALDLGPPDCCTATCPFPWHGSCPHEHSYTRRNYPTYDYSHILHEILTRERLKVFRFCYNLSCGVTVRDRGARQTLCTTHAPRLAPRMFFQNLNVSTYPRSTIRSIFHADNLPHAHATRDYLPLWPVPFRVFP